MRGEHIPLSLDSMRRPCAGVEGGECEDEGLMKNEAE